MPVRKDERSQINDHNFHLKKLKNKEQTNLKVKVRVEVKHIESRKTIEKTKETKTSSSRMSVKEIISL